MKKASASWLLSPGGLRQVAHLALLGLILLLRFALLGFALFVLFLVLDVVASRFSAIRLGLLRLAGLKLLLTGLIVLRLPGRPLLLLLHLLFLALGFVLV